MIVSRIFPLLIRSKVYINFQKTKLLQIDDRLLKGRNFAKVSSILLKKMCDDVDEQLDNRRRHFDYNQLVEKLKDEKLFVIDVREYSEIRETGKIPGSLNVPLGELKKALKEYTAEDFKKHYLGNKPTKEDEIVFTCKSGNRSMRALRIALELGYCRSGNYKGGWIEWSEKTKKPPH